MFSENWDRKKIKNIDWCGKCYDKCETPEEKMICRSSEGGAAK